MRRRDCLPCLSCLLVLVLCLGGCVCKPYEPGPALSASAFKHAVHTLASPEMEGRDAGSDGIVLARDYLVEQFMNAGLEPAFTIDGKPSYTQPFDLPIGVTSDGEPVIATIRNVGGVLPGQGELADEVVVVGGHYDHVGFGDIGARNKDRKGELHPGADDNASGTAGVVLLARHFAQTHHEPGAPRRTILFTCFAGEERGLHGSRYMARHPDQYIFGPGKTVAMINLDMIGRLRNDELYIFGDTSGAQWRDWTNAANEALGLDLKWDVRPPGGSDHSMFIAAGVPAIFFNTWLHPDYHTPDDTPDKVNNEGGVKVLTLVAKLLEHTATADETPTFVVPEPPKPRPYLGVLLQNNDRGVLIAEVPEGPMKKAGAKAGDILLTLGGKQMNSPGNVRTWLNTAKSGDKVVAEVLRGDETVQLNVRLDIRR